GFQFPWLPSGCLDEPNTFCGVRRASIQAPLTLAFGSSRIASSAYQKWPTSCFNPKASNHSLYLTKLNSRYHILRKLRQETSYQMVRLVFRPYTQIRRSICTSELLRASTRVSLASPYSGIVHYLSGPNSYALYSNPSEDFRIGRWFTRKGSHLRSLSLRARV
ncbi:hypothetical protein N7447_011231, partial [Penicillium robsamsonii]|uniref:uncharacterized protein n=1 Tax=Penicillium robsamsonii TaxID=1792511 RepID=UPI002548C97B